MKCRIRCLVLLLALFFFSGCSSHDKISYDYRGNVKVIIAMGNRTMVPEGRNVPVEVIVSGDYASENYKVALTVPTNAEDFYCYQKDIKHDEEDTIVFFVPIASKSNQMVVEILDENERAIYSRTCSYQMSSRDEDEEELLVGMIGLPEESPVWNFTGTYENLEYQVRTVKIEPENLLNFPEAYEPYSLLIMQADTLKEWSKEERQTIEDWIKEGNAFWLLGSPADASELGFSLFSKISYSPQIGPRYVYRYRIENGKLSVSTLAVFEKIDTLEEQREFLEAILKNRLSGTLQDVEKQYQIEAAVIEELDWQGSIGIMADKKIYFAIFCIYLLFIIPGIYYILRRKDRLHWFRICICVTACLVSMIIWLAGSKTRFSKPFLHSISITTQGQNEVTERVYVSTQAPYNREYEISFLPEYEIWALQKDNLWVGNGYNSYESHEVVLQKKEEANYLKLGNMPAFTAQYFELNKKIETFSGISGGIWGIGEEKIGQLKNYTDTDLSQIAILLGDQVILADSWKRNEWLDLSKITHCLSVEEFLEGGYASWKEWGTKYGGIYEGIVAQYAHCSFSYACLIAQMDKPVDIQYQEEYQQKKASLFVAEIKLY